MYYFDVSQKLQDAFSEIKDQKKSTLNKHFKELSANPFARSKKTGVKNIGEYYINAGNKYCILFNVNKSKKIIFLLDVVSSPKFHKTLKEARLLRRNRLLSNKPKLAALGIGVFIISIFIYWYYF